MKNIRQHTGIVEIIQRLPSSSNGNPRYLLKVDGRTCRTSPDSSLGYSVTNYEGKTVTATIGEHYGYATLNSIKEV